MGKKGGGDSTTEYVQSPEAREVMNLMMPTIERIGMAGQYGGVVPEGATYGGFGADDGAGVGTTGGGKGGLFGGSGGLAGDVAGQAGLDGRPMTSGLLWGPGSYDVPGYGMPSPYDVPDIAGMMPTETTMGAISQDVRQAVMAPYKEIEQQLLETLGAGGGLGSARGGFSGQGAAGVGRYWGDVAPEYTRSLWGMVAPAQQAGWQAELGRGRDVYGAELGREASLFGAGLGRERDIWGQEQMARQFPFSVIPGMAGSAMPSPVVSQGGGKK